MTSEGQHAGQQPAEATSGGGAEPYGTDGFPPDSDGQRHPNRPPASFPPPATGSFPPPAQTTPEPHSYAPPPLATPNGGSPFVVPAVPPVGQAPDVAQRPDGPPNRQFPDAPPNRYGPPADPPRGSASFGSARVPAGDDSGALPHRVGGSARVEDSGTRPPYAGATRVDDNGTHPPYAGATRVDDSGFLPPRVGGSARVPTGDDGGASSHPSGSARVSVSQDPGTPFRDSGAPPQRGTSATGDSPFGSATSGSGPAASVPPQGTAPDDSAWAPRPAPSAGQPFGRTAETAAYSTDDEPHPYRATAPSGGPLGGPGADYDGYAPGSPTRGAAGRAAEGQDPSAEPPASGRPPGISAFGDQRVRVPGATLTGLPDGPPPVRLSQDDSGALPRRTPSSDPHQPFGPAGTAPMFTPPPSRAAQQSSLPPRGSLPDAVPVRGQAAYNAFGSAQQSEAPLDRSAPGGSSSEFGATGRGPSAQPFGDRPTSGAPEQGAPFRPLLPGQPGASVAQPADHAAPDDPPYGRPTSGARSEEPTSGPFGGSAPTARPGEPLPGRPGEPLPGRAGESPSGHPGDSSPGRPGDMPFGGSAPVGRPGDAPFGGSAPGSRPGDAPFGRPTSLGSGGPSPFGEPVAGPFAPPGSFTPPGSGAHAGSAPAGGQPFGPRPAAAQPPAAATPGDASRNGVAGRQAPAGPRRFDDAGPPSSFADPDQNRPDQNSPFGATPPDHDPSRFDRPASGQPDQGRSVSGIPDQGRPVFGTPGQDRPVFGSQDQPVFGQDRSVFGSPKQDQPTFGAPGQDQPAFGAPGQDQPTFGAPGQDRPGFGRAEQDQPAFGQDRPGFGRAEQDQPAFGQDRPGFGGAEQDQPAFGGPDQDRPGFGRAKPGRGMFGRAHEDDAFDGPDGSPFARASQESGYAQRVPGASFAANGSPVETPEARNSSVPQPRDPAEGLASGSARPVASASVPVASRVSPPADADDAPPPPAAGQARVYGRAAPPPEDDEAPGDQPDRTEPPRAWPWDQRQTGTAPEQQPAPTPQSPVRASGRATASARVTPPPPPPPPAGPDAPHEGPPYSEFTTDVAGRGRPAPPTPPNHYGEPTTDVSGRSRGDQPYVPAPALPSMHAAPPREGGPPNGQQASAPGIEGERPRMGGVFPGPASRATVTPPPPDQTASWPNREPGDEDQGRFDQFKPDPVSDTAAKQDTTHVRMLPVLLGVIIAAALIIGLAFGLVYLISGDSDASGFSISAGECVKQNGEEAVKAGCGDPGAFEVVSIADTKEKCGDPGQPHVVNPTGDGRTQVLCLKPRQ